jgi:DNA-binding transcriptional ArsR family regulator
VDEERTIEEILDTIGDKKARAILAAISRNPLSAKKLSESLDLSLPTVYRRVELLQEHELLKTRTYVADDGNHYDVYESNFDSTVIRLEDSTGEYDIRIYRKENVPDWFAGLWNDLST